jgi:hypothetical protein
LHRSLSHQVHKNIGLDLYHVAEADDRFLCQPEVPVFGHLTYAQAAYKIQLVNTALNILEVLKKCSEESDGVGGGIQINEKAWANLEHLLLRVRHCLVRTFVLKAWDEVRESPEWRYHQRRQLRLGGDKWCAEFSNNQRPVSTTWPWSIRPSLAVLWGVCWMFYPLDGGERQRQGSGQHMPQPLQQHQQEEQQQQQQRQYGWQPVYGFGTQPAVSGQMLQHPTQGT